MFCFAKININHKRQYRRDIDVFLQIKGLFIYNLFNKVLIWSNLARYISDSLLLPEIVVSKLQFSAIAMPLCALIFLSLPSISSLVHFSQVLRISSFSI